MSCEAAVASEPACQSPNCCPWITNQPRSMMHSLFVQECACRVGCCLQGFRSPPRLRRHDSRRPPHSSPLSVTLCERGVACAYGVFVVGMVLVPGPPRPRGTCNVNLAGYGKCSREWLQLVCPM
eukprot:1157457-Pelagomonas_calceolata.AAC.4